MTSDMPEWKQSIFDKTAPRTADSLSVTVSLMMDDLFFERPLSFDGFIPDTVNPLRLCVALRLVCRNKDKIPYWDEALAVAEQACLLDGLDPKKALSGLLK